MMFYFAQIKRFGRDINMIAVSPDNDTHHIPEITLQRKMRLGRTA
jgi:hypothetical protein